MESRGQQQAVTGQNNVLVVEVGPRDGLQNETAIIPTAVKIDFIDALSSAGLPVIEATSFVNPKAVPQLADAADIMCGIARAPGVRYPVLIPNAKGLERALESDVTAIALFTAATEEFAQANVGTSIAGTFERFEPVVTVARERQIWVRGYVSVAFGCPYFGPVSISRVIPVVDRLLALGCDEVCLADTIGSAEPNHVGAVVRSASQSLPIERLALHFHDTSGHAIGCVAAGLDHGVRIFDAAAGGLGGCPFAPGAPGNLSTEVLVDFLNHVGLRPGVNREQITDALCHLTPYVPRLQPISS